jgi:hypothetical protein
MKTNRKLTAYIAGLLLFLQLLTTTSLAENNTKDWFGPEQDLRALLETLAQVEPVPFDQMPKDKYDSFGYWSFSSPQNPPLPFNPHQLNFWYLGSGFFVLDDRQFTPDSLKAGSDDDASMQDNYLFRGSYSSLYSTNDLWLEIIEVDLTNQLANLLLHNTDETKQYQLLSKTNLAQPGDWNLGEIKSGDYGTKDTLFSPVNITGNDLKFFRAQQADWRISISSGSDAVEPRGSDPGLTGNFYIYGSIASGVTNDLVVYYRISGTASNGVDYVSLPGMATVTNSAGFVAIDVQPLADNFLEGVESVALIIVPTNTYLIEPAVGNNTATINIVDSSTTLQIYPTQNAIEPDGPPNVPAMPGIFMVYRSDSRTIYTNLAVNYLISGTASNGLDYQLLTGVLNFQPGIDQTNIDINPLKDNLPERLETVTLTLVPTNTYLIDVNASTATVTMIDSTTTVSLGNISTSAVEPNGPMNAFGVSASFFVHRADSRGIYTNLTVRYAVSGTASNGVDYSFLNGAINFAPEMTDTNIIVAPLADSVLEGLETVTVTLLDLATNGYSIDTNNKTGTATIIDTTTTVSLTVSVNSAIETDGPPGTPAKSAIYSLHRSDTRGIYTNLAIAYNISGTASNGVDYVFLSGTARFEPGMADTNILITPLADTAIEGLETVAINLVNSTTNSYLINTNQIGGIVSIIDTTTTVGISATGDAIEPRTDGTGGQTGSFRFTRTDTRGIYTNLTVQYSISGTASNSLDYTNLTGFVTFATGSTATNIFVQPIADNLIWEGTETVTLTLLANLTNLDGYLISSNTATVNIADAPPIFGFITNIISPIGVDYFGPSNCLIVSVNYGLPGITNDFALVYTNLFVSNSVVMRNVIVTPWTRLNNLAGEIKLATVKTNMAGFTNADTYFGSSTPLGNNSIGWLSADGTRSNLNWCVLTNSTVTTTLPLRGSLYVDQTGVFSNNIIAVTSDSGASAVRKGIWRVDAQANPILLTNLLTQHLEGVITLPNDTSKWGAWAGKIVTGDEDLVPPVIYTIATNGAVVAYTTTNFYFSGIHPEDFDIIPPNQNLYGCDNGINALVKLPASYFTNFVGDLLITDAGENIGPAKLCVVHWDAASTNFVSHTVLYLRPDGTAGSLEHVTFAPIDIPSK